MRAPGLLFKRSHASFGAPPRSCTQSGREIHVEGGDPKALEENKIANVEIRHCDKDGVYSEYTGQPGVSTDQSSMTFLRGLETADAAGQVSLSTIYPGWYGGRATYIHIEVHLGGKIVTTTQMAFTDATNTAVSSSPLSLAKGQNPLTNGPDMMFSDGDELQRANLSGDVTSGFTATPTIGIQRPVELSDRA